MAGPIVSFLHWCSRVSSISRIFGREPSLVSPSVRLLHTENEAELEDTHATGWATVRSLMTNPRSAWRSCARSGEVSCAEAGTHGAARASQADVAVPVSFGIRLVMASPVAFHLAGLGGRV